jgi:selenide,water dikinase
LAHVLRHLDGTEHPNLIIGTETGDDAAVWRLDDSRALVGTADFITPVVDDARTWGRIAATNALSDVYAMGGRPLFALNLVGWNSDALGIDLLDEVLQGGAEAVAAAGATIVGGHTVDDPEPKYGLSVTGEVHPDRVLTNNGLRPGDHLVLTKPLGVGIISTAIKADAAPEPVVAAAVESMVQLNDLAAATALESDASGCTDVTGFGLLGHLGRMCRESGVGAELDVAAIPFITGAQELADQGFIPGGSKRNLAWIRDHVDPGNHDELTLLLLADAQTSGGLLFGVSPDRSGAAVSALVDTGHTAAVIGRVTDPVGLLALV